MNKLKNNYFPEFRAFLLGRTKPAIVTVNITSRCNQHCIYCEIGQDLDSALSNALTTEDMYWLLDEMSSQNIPRISLCGGEPFLFEGLIDIVEYAGERDIRCSITSNGMTVYKLHDRDFDLLRRYKADINISIDSFDENIQSLTRGVPTALGNAIKSVDKLAAEGIPVTVLATISRYNLHDLFPFVVKAYQMGIKQVLFQPIIHYTNYPDRPAIDGKKSLNVPPDQLPVLMENLENILNFEKRHNINTNVYRIMPWIRHYIESSASRNGKWFFGEVLEKFYCREIFATIDIAYDGGIQPCALTRAKISIKDHGERGLMELWQEATKTIRDDITNEHYYDYCNACCNKFSRNMLASIIKYPWKNRKAAARLAPLIFSRVVTKTKKKLSMVK
jgi:MoaA/NifB/PqqE/SkfB family radical SAM enzyme